MATYRHLAAVRPAGTVLYWACPHAPEALGLEPGSRIYELTLADLDAANTARTADIAQLIERRGTLVLLVPPQPEATEKAA